MTDGLRIHAVKITPVAFRDPALLNAVGVHEPYALRAIVEVDTGECLVGLGETYADVGHLRRSCGRLRTPSSEWTCTPSVPCTARSPKSSPRTTESAAPD